MAKVNEWGDAVVEDSSPVNEWGDKVVDDSNKPVTRAQLEAQHANDPKTPETSWLAQFPSEFGKESLTALPGYGSPSAFKEGYESGKDVLGDNIFGKTLGAVAGTSEALGTIGDFATKTLRFPSQVAQATYDKLSGNGENANQALLGNRPLFPNLHTYDPKDESIGEVGKAFLSNLAVPMAQDPLNTAMMVEGLRSPTKFASGVKTGIQGAVELGQKTKDAIVKPKGITTPEFGDHILKGDKVIEPDKMVNSDFANKITSAFANDLPKGKKGVKVDAFKQAVQDAGIELHRTNPNITDAGELYEANEATRKRAGEVLNQARQQQGLPNITTADLINNVKQSLLKNDELVQQFGPKAIESALSSESLHLLENFPELNPDQLQNFATQRKGMANKSYEQLSSNQGLNLDQNVNLSIHKEFVNALDNMYKETPGADYARKVYGATKTIDKGIDPLTEKLARQAYKDNPNLKQVITSPATLLGGALTLAGESKAGIGFMGIKLLSQGAKMVNDHLHHPNTKIRKAFDSLRSKVHTGEDVKVQPPPTSNTPPPSIPALSAEDQ